MATRNIYKQLAGMEDILTGKGTVSQSRGGSAVTISRVDVPFAVESKEALQALDINKYTHARLYGTDGEYVEYIFDQNATTGISSGVGPGRWVIKTSSVLHFEFATFSALATGSSLQGKLQPEDIARLYDKVVPLRTIVHNTTSNAGGAEYKLLTTAEKDASVYAGTEGYACVEVITGSGYWACLVIGNEIKVDSLGSKPDYNLEELTGTDNTIAIQQALSLSYAKSNLFSGWRVNTVPIVFGVGRYGVKTPSTLFSGLTSGSFEIKGHGKGYFRRDAKTMLVFDSENTTDIMINNPDVFGATTFKDIGFYSVNSGVFMDMSGQGKGYNQSITFDSCSWAGFGLIFRETVDFLGSEITFMNCKVGNFNDAFLDLASEQAVNVRIINTDIEVFSGTVFRFRHGANITVYQGSIIPTSASAKLVDVPSTADANKFGQNNQHQLSMYGTRFEIRNSSPFISKQSAGAPLSLYFNAVGLGTRTKTVNSTTDIDWLGGGELIFDNCTAAENLVMNHSYNGSGTVESEMLRITADGGLARGFLINSTFGKTGAGNVSLAPLLNIKNCEEGINGCYHAYSSSKKFCSLNSYFVTFSNSSWLVEEILSPAGGPVTKQINIPTTRLNSIKIKTETTASYGSNTITLTFKKADTTVLATQTWTLNAASTEYVLPLHDYIGDGYIDCEITSSYTGGSVFAVGGYLTMVY